MLTLLFMSRMSGAAVGVERPKGSDRTEGLALSGLGRRGGVTLSLWRHMMMLVTSWYAMIDSHSLIDSDRTYRMIVTQYNTMMMMMALFCLSKRTPLLTHFFLAILKYSHHHQQQHHHHHHLFPTMCGLPLPLPRNGGSEKPNTSMRAAQHSNRGNSPSGEFYL